MLEIKSKIFNILSKNGHSLEPLTELNESNNNHVFASENLIVKVNKKGDNLRKEFEVLSLIYKQSPLFSKPVLIETDECYTFLVQTKLLGQNLSHVWHKLSNPDKELLLNHLCELLKKLHSTSFSSLNYYEYNFFNEIKLIKKKLLRSPFKVDNQLISGIIKSIESFSSDTMGMTLIHNDLWYKNILANNNYLSGLIDFETTVIAPKAFELYRILNHKFSAKNYFETNPENYIEIDFVEMLINSIKENYSELVESFNQQDFRLYNSFLYLKRLSNYDKEWFSITETNKYFKEMVDFNKFKL